MAGDNTRQSVPQKGKRSATGAGTGAKKRASQARKVRLAERRAALEAEQIEQARAAAGVDSDAVPTASRPGFQVTADNPEYLATGDNPEQGKSPANQYGGLLEGEKRALDATGSAAQVLIDIMNSRKATPDVRRKAANDLLAVAQRAKERERPGAGQAVRQMTLKDLLLLREMLIQRQREPQPIDITPTVS